MTDLLHRPWPWYVTGPLAGAGIGVMAVTILAAVVGTWTYGYLRPRLPH